MDQGAVARRCQGKLGPMELVHKSCTTLPVKICKVMHALNTLFTPIVNHLTTNFLLDDANCFSSGQYSSHCQSMHQQPVRYDFDQTTKLFHSNRICTHCKQFQGLEANMR